MDRTIKWKSPNRSFDIIFQVIIISGLSGFIWRELYDLTFDVDEDKVVSDTSITSDL